MVELNAGNIVSARYVCKIPALDKKPFFVLRKRFKKNEKVAVDCLRVHSDFALKIVSSQKIRSGTRLTGACVTCSDVNCFDYLS